MTRVLFSAIIFICSLYSVNGFSERGVDLQVVDAHGLVFKLYDKKFRLQPLGIHRLGRTSYVELEDQEVVYVTITHFKETSTHGTWELDSSDAEDNDTESSGGILRIQDNVVHPADARISALKITFSPDQPRAVLRLTRRNQGWKDGNWNPVFEKIIFTRERSKIHHDVKQDIEKPETQKKQDIEKTQFSEVDRKLGLKDCDTAKKRENLLLSHSLLDARDLIVTLSPNPKCLTVALGKAQEFEIRKWERDQTRGKGHVTYSVVPRTELRGEFIAARGRFSEDSPYTYLAENDSGVPIRNGELEFLRLSLVLEEAQNPVDNTVVSFDLPPVRLSSVKE